jgi:PAS domain S-box-containing protein
VSANLLLLVGMVGSLLVLAWVFFLFYREGIRRAKTETALTLANRDLEQRIEERTRALQNKERFLSAVIDNMRDAMFVVRPGAVILANRACLALLGATSPDQVIGKPALRFFPAAGHERIRARSGEILAGDQEARTAAVTIIRLDGKTLDAEVTSTSFPDGEQRLLLVMLRDVSAIRATEQQLRQAQKMEAMGQLTGGIAHDFNNLLAVILGNLELIEEGLAERPQLRELARSAIDASERGATLTRNLLAFARRQPLSPVEVDLNRLVRDMVGMLVRALGETIEIEIVAGASLWKCEADPGQLQNALVNLAINARDAMPDGGKLTIETANSRLDDNYAAQNSEVSAGQYVTLIVSDTGTGMPPEVIERAFDPFFTTKSADRGSGLGLSMVYGFAKQSNGHVKIYSEPGHGTTVKLYLPRSYGTGASRPADLEPDLIRSGAGTVLLVEDDQQVRALAVRLLRSLGYDVLEAATAAEAMQAIDSQSDIMLLLTDVILAGGTNGRELAERAVANRPGLKVVYMSGYSENAILHHGRLDPGVQLLQKPFRRKELAEKIRLVLELPAK